MASIDRARGYTAGLGMDMGFGLGNGDGDGDVGDSRDFETLRREEEVQRLANLVGVNSGVW